MQEEQLRSGWLGGKFGWWRPDGRFMPIIAGAQDDPDPEGGENETEEEEEPEGEEEEGGEDQKDKGNAQAKIKALAIEKDRHAKKAKRAERELAEAQKKIKALEDANKSEEEKKGERVTELEKSVSRLESTNDLLEKRLLILNDDRIVAIGSARRRKMAEKLLIEELEIEEDGENNLSDLVDNLIKDEPQIFEEPEETEEEETPGKKTGSPPKRRKGAKDQVNRADLERRMPHLARHRAPAG